MIDSHFKRATVPALTLALGLAACAGPGPQAPPGEVLGYGTPGVSSYVPADQATGTRALLVLCDGVPRAGAPSETQGLPAACDQLRRTLRNQPGNTVQAGRVM